MTPDPFREALDNLVWAASMSQGSASPLLLRALAEVERLYAARVGEEYEVQVIRSEYDFVGVVLDDDKYSPGDRVFVTKGDAG